MAGFTERYLETLKPKAGQIQSDFMDTNADYRGFGVRVGRRNKTWFWFYPWGGRRVRLKLGTYPAVSLAEARRRVTEARGCIDALPPIDPRDHFLAKKAAHNTVAGLIDEYFEKHSAQRERDSAQVQKRRDPRHRSNSFGDAASSRYRPRDRASSIPGALVGAQRLYTMLSAMFEWATARGDFEHNPMEKMRRPDAPDQPRTRVLSADEIRVVWNGTEAALGSDARAKGVAHILRLCLATAGRIGEVTGIRKSELDLAAKTWLLPAARSKNAHEHLRPLSSLASEIIEEAKGRSEFLFPISVTRVQQRIVGLHEKLRIPHFTAHDLRRTAATQMAGLGTNQLVIGHLLGHRSIMKATVTALHYDQHDYMPEMRAALELWADRLREIIA